MCRTTVFTILFVTITIPPCNVVVLSTICDSLEGKPLNINQPVLKLVEKFRQGMADGFPQLDLPVLAPFAWKELHVKDFDNNMLRFNAELKDGITRGLNQFNITSLNVHIPSRKLDFKLTFPSVQTIGRYVAKGQLAGFVPFDRSGRYSLQLYALNIHGTVHFTIWRKHLLVRDMHIVPTVKTSQANLENIMLMPWNTSLFNRIVSGQIPEYLRNNRKAIALHIKAIMKPKLNQILWRYGVEDILKMINVTQLCF